MMSMYWKTVPQEHRNDWEATFTNNTDGPNISVPCPICKNIGLHRYYQVGKKVEKIVNAKHYIAEGAEWQWCSCCRFFEHKQVLVPDWWEYDMEIDGDKLTAIPEIINMAYEDFEKVNKWNTIPKQYILSWDEVFSDNGSDMFLKEKCPICGEYSLRQYYAIAVTQRMRYKRKKYQGQGASWKWCASCFHYSFCSLDYIPIEWMNELDIAPWELMTIPEPLNERLNSIYGIRQ